MNAVRSVVRGVGELSITAGLVVLLFVAYQLVWTNVEAGREQSRVAEEVRADWQRPLGRTVAQPDEPEAERLEVRPGKGFGFLYIPRLGDDYVVPVLEGVGLDVLARGVGHYPNTALPGEKGNFGVAGHRATNGEPFAYLDRLRPGDAVVVETQTSWLTYVVDRTEIVLPQDVWVLDPVPGKPRAEPKRELITLTTCNPRWASTERMIVFGHLEERQAKGEGRPLALAGGRG